MCHRLAFQDDGIQVTTLLRLGGPALQETVAPGHVIRQCSKLSLGLRHIHRAVVLATGNEVGLAHRLAELEEVVHHPLVAHARQRFERSPVSGGTLRVSIARAAMNLLLARLTPHSASSAVFEASAAA